MNNVTYQDTYFIDADTALLESKKNNQIATSNSRIFGLQICYYNAEEPLDNAPENCIFVPFENVYNYFVRTKNRIPTNLSFLNTSYDINEQQELALAFDNIIKTAKKERENLVSLYIEELQKLKPNFEEKPWRVFIPACRETSVMQFISKNISIAFKELEYEVCYSIQDNAMQSCLDPLPTLHNLFEFNPHITININHLNNTVINDSIFNIVWFQDSMEIVTNKVPLNLRKRDMLFALIPGIKEALMIKSAKATKLQSFCIDTNIYKENPSIKREKKIVFIGGSYKNNIEPYINEVGGKAIDDLNDENCTLLLNEMIDIYRNDGYFDHKEVLHKLAKKYSKSKYYVTTYLISYLIRDITILELCKMNIDYEIEIYGWGWEEYDELKPYYKGVLNYGEDISKVYNSAEYALVSHPDYLIQQRTLEAAASGCTPLVFDCRYSHLTEPPYHEESLVFFKDLLSLENILNKDKEKSDLQKIVKEHSYINFSDKIINLIKEELKNEE